MDKLKENVYVYKEKYEQLKKENELLKNSVKSHSVIGGGGGGGGAPSLSSNTNRSIISKGTANTQNNQQLI